MSTISTVLIVKNEGEQIIDCLKTVKWADEIVVMDSGSTDDTIEKARELNARTFVNADWQGYGIQRQRAQQQATSDWVFMIDADERVTDKLREEIRRAAKANDQSKVYAVPRLSYCFGRYIRHGGWYPDYVVRLYPRCKAQYGPEQVHEKLHNNGLAVVRLKGDLLHFTYRDLEHYLVKSAGYAAAWGRARAQQGRRATLWQGFLHGVGCFLRMYVVRAGFLDGKAGLLLALLSAHSTFAKYADLWTRYQPKP
ncbi:MAG: glycosyltransferase family 2 protein [Acidiferrobacterales bacterium]